ncbi:MAG TPA: prepilin peptidase [Gammaproteobacteria bacterium]|nr:prepilin peptidase [Gammaproteobacteria bacterium]
MLIHEFLDTYPVAFIATSLVLGLMIGSFLNVVIYRLPIMLQNDWRNQCEEYLELAQTTEEKTFNLAKPASACPHCNHKIRAWENIPVISFILLRGRCSQCKNRISVRYPVIELVCGLMTAGIAWHFGYGFQALAAMFLTWSLISLSVIDFDTKLLPDIITLPLLWAGLLLNLDGTFTTLENSVIGAVAGYMSLWSIYQIHHLVTGREGMGFGDFKLLAVLGAWLGWQSILVIVLLSSLVGALVGITLIVVMGRDKQLPIPFGPYLATAGWISLMWGKDLTQIYFGLSGMNG